MNPPNSETLQPCQVPDPLAYWLLTQLFNFWGSYKVVDSESFNFYYFGFWASELKPYEDQEAKKPDVDLQPKGFRVPGI